MAKSKLTLKDIKKATGVGGFVVRTIVFHDCNGQVVEGEIKIKILSNDEIIEAPKQFGNLSEVTIDQYHRSIISVAVHDPDETLMFENAADVNILPQEVVAAMYAQVDETLDISGKRRASLMTTNSGAS